MPRGSGSFWPDLGESSSPAGAGGTVCNRSCRSFPIGKLMGTWLILSPEWEPSNPSSAFALNCFPCSCPYSHAGCDWETPLMDIYPWRYSPDLRRAGNCLWTRDAAASGMLQLQGKQSPWLLSRSHAGLVCPPAWQCSKCLKVGMEPLGSIQGSLGNNVPSQVALRRWRNSSGAGVRPGLGLCLVLCSSDHRWRA